MKLGVRQGCRAAPFLWASSMSRLMSKLAALTSPDWVLRVLTLYADDFLLQCEVQNEHDLWDHLHFVGILFDLLEQAGLTMNLSKTVALFQLQGRKMRKIQSRVLVKSDNQWHLLIPRSQQQELNWLRMSSILESSCPTFITKGSLWNIDWQLANKQIAGCTVGCMEKRA